MGGHAVSFWRHEDSSTTLAAPRGFSHQWNYWCFTAGATAASRFAGLRGRDGGDQQRVCELGAVVDVQFSVDVGEVEFDRPRAQKQRVGDALVRAALGDQCRDLQLLGGQLVAADGESALSAAAA